MLIRTSGADVSSYIWPDQAVELALLLGNGLEIPKTALLPLTLTSTPRHRRGCLTYPLEEDMRFVTLALDDQVALVLRARWADHFAAWTPLARQAELEQLERLLNEEIAQAWRRYRAGQSETNHQ